MKKIVSIIFAVLVCFILTGCTALNKLSSYIKLDSTEFESRLEELGYTGISEYTEDTATQYKCNCNGIEVSLLIATSNDVAASVYTQLSSQLKDMVNAHANLTGNSRARWTGSSSENFYAVYLIDNTMLALGSSKDDKEEIERIATILTSA